MSDGYDGGIARLEAKLDTMIRLLALQLLTKEQTRWEQALLLDKAGLSAREIAIVCATEPDLIEKTILEAKKQGKR